MCVCVCVGGGGVSRESVLFTSCWLMRGESGMGWGFGIFF